MELPLAKSLNELTLPCGIDLAGFMKVQDKLNIIQDISRMISRAEEKCFQWRIGMTADPDWQLFHISMTAPNFQYFSFWKTINSHEARDIAIAFCNIFCEEILPEMEHPNEEQVFVFAYCKGQPKSGVASLLRSFTRPWEYLALASPAPDFHLLQHRN